MQEIKKPEELMAVSVRQGVDMNETEAEVVLGYLEGHDYCLKIGEKHKLWRHDNQEGENVENDIPYTILEVIEFCQEMNSEILLDAESKPTTEPDYIIRLREDEMLLEHMMEKAMRDKSNAFFKEKDIKVRQKAARQRIDALDITVSALSAQTKAEKNEPLTADELWGMDGDTDKIRISIQKDAGEWKNVDAANGRALLLTGFGVLRFEDYGKTWLAYRRKPEEEI